MTYIDIPRAEQRYPDLRALRWSDAGAVRMAISTNTFAILSSERMETVLIDVNEPTLFPLVEQIVSEGYTPAALLISHDHVAVHGRRGITQLRERYDMPVFLHPLDAGHAELRAIPFQNPVGSELLAKFDLEVELFPGQTRGSVVAYWHRHGTVMFTGDSSTGATLDDELRGVRRVMRPPASTSWSDEELKRNWERFNRSVAGLAPYHGAIYLDAANDMPAFLQSLRNDPPMVV